MNAKRLRLAVLAAAMGFASLFVGEMPTLVGGPSFVSRAEAVVGRPRTPVSYAGVARRTTYRAVTPNVVVAPRAVVVAPAPVVVVAPRPGCYQAVNGYGQIYWRCP